MKSFLFASMALLLFLTTSCQKEELLEPALSNVDYRDQLVGTYEGTLSYKDVIQVEDNPTKKTEAEVLEQHTIEIAKAPNSNNGLVVDGNLLNIVPQSADDKNKYEDVFLYAGKDCSGQENYKLLFYPEEKRLVLEYKHQRSCTVGSLDRYNFFEGIKKAP